MDDNVDSICYKFIKKLNLLQKANKRNCNYKNNLNKKIYNLRVNFFVFTTKFVFLYMDKFHLEFKKRNFSQRIESLFSDIVLDNTKENKEIKREWENTKIILNPLKKNSSVCHCGSEQTVANFFFNRKECDVCGHITELNQYIQSSSTASYNPSKHGKLWLDRIQAKENIMIPSDLLQKIKKKIEEEMINVDLISCNLIRSYLSLFKGTKYNNNVVLIKKMITKKDPPVLSEEEKRIIMNYFMKIISIYDKIKPNEKINFPYHPYFIYKIIESKIEREDKNEILKNIHLQSSYTIKKNDFLWKLICNNIDIEYKPTVI